MLEDEIRNAAGRLAGLTLWPSPKGWQGNARWNGNLGWTVEHDADPAEALLKALRSTTRYEGEKPKPVAAPAAPAEPEIELKGGLFD